MKDFDYYVNLDYEIKLRKLSDDEGSGWFAQISLLPGCMSDGETIEECLANLEDAKRGWIETCIELGRPVPEPGKTTSDFSGQLRVRMPKSLHQALSEKAKEENVSLNQFILYQLSRGIGYKG
ncbi:MAG: toxin-antitoxin system HicB family antitoxin [Desulfitobacterium hafniense]|nr:toxin-antitoxin system HicB family antitoxin [Desulfitobacterium hafniense]